MKSATVAEISDTTSVAQDGGKLDQIADYWNQHIHDLAIAKSPVGTREFFQELDAYRFEKLDYLPRMVDFSRYREQRLLEVGCGVGLDLARFAKNGAIVTGIDLAQVSIQLAKQNFQQQGLTGELSVMNGEALQFPEGSFDVVYAHGVLQYTNDAHRMIQEIHRVLKPGGRAIVMVYNRCSWLNFLSMIANVQLEHEDAPVLEKYTISELTEMLGIFSQIEIVPERFPVRTRLHGGLKGIIYNDLFVNMFHLIPRPLVRQFGWHLMAFAAK